MPCVVTVKVPAEPSVKAVLAPDVMEGGPSTVRVKLWLASGLTPLAAPMVSRYTPWAPVAGVPARVAVPSPLSVKVTPLGSAPFSVSAEVGNPVDVTVKLPAWPSVKVAASAEVMAGGVSTVRAKLWLASGLTPLDTPMVTS